MTFRIPRLKPVMWVSLILLGPLVVVAFGMVCAGLLESVGLPHLPLWPTILLGAGVFGVIRCWIARPRKGSFVETPGQRYAGMFVAYALAGEGFRTYYGGVAKTSVAFSLVLAATITATMAFINKDWPLLSSLHSRPPLPIEDLYAQDRPRPD